jgi:hypothetical protein
MVRDNLTFVHVQLSSYTQVLCIADHQLRFSSRPNALVP